jgi:hypothetical protein
VSRGSRQWLHRTGGHSTVEVAFDCLSALYISRGTREEMNAQFLLETYQRKTSFATRSVHITHDCTSTLFKFCSWSESRLDLDKG